MVERSRFAGARQKAVLAKLQKNIGKEATDVASAIGLSYPQYLRYARGKVPIRSDQMEAFAVIYGVDPLDLAAELAGVDLYKDESENPRENRWTFRGALKGHIPEDMIARLALKWEGKPLVRQQAAVEGIMQLAEERRTLVSRPLKSHTA